MRAVEKGNDASCLGYDELDMWGAYDVTNYGVALVQETPEGLLKW